MAMPLTINADLSDRSLKTSTFTAMTDLDMGGFSFSYGGNSLGGAGGTAATSTMSNVILYGVIGLVLIFILQRLSK